MPSLPPRVRLALVVGIGCVVGVLAAVVISGGPTGSSAYTLVNGYAGAELPPTIPPTDFELEDQDGQTARLSAFAGHVVILSFLYSTCQDTCPLIAQQIRGALDQLGPKAAVAALAVSVDPSQDTQLNAQRFLFKQSLVGRMRFLLGSPSQLAPIWREYGIRPQSPAASTRSDHSVDTLLIDKTGRARIGFQADLLTPEALAHDIRRLETAPATPNPPARVNL